MTQTVAADLQQLAKEHLGFRAQGRPEEGDGSTRASGVA